MLTVLDEQFAPITSYAVFVNAPLERIKTYESTRERLQLAILTELTGGLRELLPHLEPLSMPATVRKLWVQTREPEWSVYFAGHVRGTESSAEGAVRGYCRHLGVPGLVMATSPHTRRRDGTGRFGNMVFSMHGENGDGIRIVAAQVGDDERWIFTNVGELQSFEQPETYKARRIRDRLTSQKIADYCAALGLYPFEEDFYGPRGLLLDQSAAYLQGRQEANPLVQKSLAQVQAEAGIVPGEAAGLPG
ncbi:hypothetical protein ACT4S5_00035 [Kocuria oceani]|uniref:hypothetical protein n=1 Tax=Kocuria oceani TaxID=988827 RepID=UPI0040367E03